MTSSYAPQMLGARALPQIGLVDVIAELGTALMYVASR